MLVGSVSSPFTANTRQCKLSPACPQQAASCMPSACSLLNALCMPPLPCHLQTAFCITFAIRLPDALYNPGEGGSGCEPVQAELPSHRSIHHRPLAPFLVRALAASASPAALSSSHTAAAAVKKWGGGGRRAGGGRCWGTAGVRGGSEAGTGAVRAAAKLHKARLQRHLEGTLIRVSILHRPSSTKRVCSATWKVP